MEASIDHPADPRTAFDDGSPNADSSRVALLLLLGPLYGWRPPENLLRDLAQVRDAFPLPQARPGARLNADEQIRRARSAYKIDPMAPRSIFDPEGPDDAGRRRAIVRDLVGKLYKQPDPEVAADILLLSLAENDERTRAAAAISATDLLDNLAPPVQVLLNILDEGVDELARQLAEVALRRLGGLRYSVAPPAPPPPPQAAGIKSALIVHGSHFGFVGTKIPKWWRPGEDFHDFIKSNFRSGLYSRPDAFTWSGGWSDHARQLAAIELRNWVRNRNLRDLDILAHSHGGNVAMWATQLGMELDQLILLSCPVHWNRYQPEFARVNHVVSYQINLDLVILADRGGTDFPDSRVSNKRLPHWFFRHDDTHNPAIWQQNGLSI